MCNSVKRETVYKIYRDMKKPKETMYLNPISALAGTGIGTFIAYQVDPGNKPIIDTCLFAAATLLGIVILNSCRFKIKKKKSKLAQKRLDVFKTEINKILKKRVSLDFDDLCFYDSYIFGNVKHNLILFTDDGLIN